MTSVWPVDDVTGTQHCLSPYHLRPWTTLQSSVRIGQNIIYPLHDAMGPQNLVSSSHASTRLTSLSFFHISRSFPHSLKFTRNLPRRLLKPAPFNDIIDTFRFVHKLTRTKMNNPWRFGSDRFNLGHMSLYHLRWCHRISTFWAKVPAFIDISTHLI